MFIKTHTNEEFISEIRIPFVQILRSDSNNSSNSQIFNSNIHSIKNVFNIY